MLPAPLSVRGKDLLTTGTPITPREASARSSICAIRRR